MSASAFCESLTFKKVYWLFHFEFFCHSTEEQDYYSKARQKQRPYRHLTDTFHSPLRPIPTHFRHVKNILDNLKTTLRYLLDSFKTTTWFGFGWWEFGYMPLRGPAWKDFQAFKSSWLPSFAWVLQKLDTGYSDHAYFSMCHGSCKEHKLSCSQIAILIYTLTTPYQLK